MPFPYPSSSASTRIRRVKDKDVRITTSSTGRKQKEISRSSNRSPSQARSTAASSLYDQQNGTADQLPLPSSGTASPSSASSPVLPPSTCAPGSVSGLVPPVLHTPAALQPYLESEAEEPTSAPADDLTPSIPKDPKPSPPVRPCSPKHQDQPLASFEVTPRRRSSQRSARTASIRSQSPPPPPVSPPFWSQPYPVPGSFDPSQGYPHLFYPHNPQAFAPPVPFQSAPPSEHFFASPYAGQQHFPMAQPTGHTVDIHSPKPQSASFFAGYTSPPAMTAHFNAVQSPPVIGYGSASSRRSLSGDPYSGMPTPTAHQPEQMPPAEKAASSGQGAKDDAVDLLQRIQSAIPDLHLLLNRYRETSGQLGDRENLIRETEAQKTAALQQKETYIERLGKELESASNRHSAESSKLRLEIGNLEEKHKELQESLVARKKSRDELEAMNRDLQGDRENNLRILQNDKEVMSREFAQWKEKVTGEFATKRKGLEDDLRRQIKDSEAILQNQIVDTTKARKREREEWLREKRDLIANNSKVRQGLEHTLQVRQTEIEEAHQKEQQDREAWNKERDTLTRAWDEERIGLDKGWEQQRAVLVAQHKTDKDELQKTWKANQARLLKRNETDSIKAQKEIDKLKAGWDTDKTKFKKATEQLKDAASTLDRENEKLQKMVEAFGDATDFRSRGDAYFTDAFNQLSKQISGLSYDHFNRPIGNPPPKGGLKDLPTGVPPFFSNTELSIQLRVKYIEHTISRILTNRIFQPFLFTLSPRHEVADQLFKEMSERLKRKSIRREALWRQHTLHAAYTVSSAKQSINKIAAVIVDEIVEEIKHFADPAQLEHITIGIRRIVKVAAETWRYARLEREIITGSMSAGSGDNKNAASTTSAALEQHREVLMPLLPIFEREPVHEELRSTADSDDQGCVYSRGLCLYLDDPVVLARLAEVEVENKDTTQNTIFKDAEAQRQEQVPKLAREEEVLEKSESLPFPLMGTQTTPRSEANPSNMSNTRSDSQKDIPTTVNLSVAINHEEGGDAQSNGDSHDDPLTVSHFSGTSSGEQSSAPTATPTDNRIPTWGTANVTAPQDGDGW